MDKLVAFVFKILGVSLLLMILLDTSATLLDVYTVYTKVSNVGSLMQNEVSRHNCLPDEMANTFAEMLDEIVDTSGVATRVAANLRYTGSNGADTGNIFTGDYGSATEGTSLNQSDSIDLFNYGDIRNIKVVVEMNLASYGFGGGEAAYNNFTKNTFTTTMRFRYTVPCLRYLK